MNFKKKKKAVENEEPVDLPSEVEETRLEEPVVVNRMVGAASGVSFSLFSRG
jgi:hypothetical protein